MIRRVPGSIQNYKDRLYLIDAVLYASGNFDYSMKFNTI